MGLTPAMNVEGLSAAIGKLEASLDRIEGQLAGGASAGAAAAPGGGGGGGAADETPSVRGWDSEVQPLLAEFYALSEKVGGVVHDQAQAAKETFDSFRTVLADTATQAKPDDVMAKLGELLGPVGAKLAAAQEFTSAHARSDQINHLKAVAEGVASLSWVFEALPAPFIDNARASSEFWSNKILREFKGKDALHVDWVGAFNNMLKAMAAYAKRVHTQGLTWGK